MGRRKKTCGEKNYPNNNALLKNVNAEYSTVEKTRLEKS